MEKKLSFSSSLVIGVMLFALFFGAGNLIFPAELGQLAGTNTWKAMLGFLFTGVGLPFLGILAIGYSGSRDLQELASRIHPLYALIFTSVLYLTIGPFFAAPRTGAVAFDIGIAPFLNDFPVALARFLFTLLFFGISMWLSLNPAKIVDRVGKLLSPLIIILLIGLIAMTVFKPMGIVQPAQIPYTEGAFFTGFLEGYNTMDALASLVFGIIVIKAVQAMGITDKKQILTSTAKTGFVAAGFLAIIYLGIAYLGAASVDSIGYVNSGGAVLSETASYYFGSIGFVLLGIVIMLACLTTAIGLLTACGEYFHSIIPIISYKWFVVIFSTFCLTVANFGLANIINFSLPVLVLLYPLAMVLIILTFTGPLFHQSKLVYQTATAAAFLISSVEALVKFYKLVDHQLPAWISWINKMYTDYIPYYAEGIGWLVPVLIVTAVFGLSVVLSNKNSHKKRIRA
ncbi:MULTISPECIES: branched-chain amino acid transport system II carrier protein [unclassified Sporosarcina]|uniref:branched-chain amino acid transport system II carrier protein n=1 Tax=unclassified Sporosarcina TaxID=2647733 RepID=UPI00203BFA6F|nr:MULTISPECIES: branched-chain amino acid transport system II carrier protein [unclassified Sporosarcina]GKV64750.1 branched-chain amino acid transport system carrier protein [Sporosarcina sp. NCCP-2331]GLB54860.1 branched-chain amino acid transport system carrier protein [Sporosarcina sp. NCCP-2378]